MKSFLNSRGCKCTPLHPPAGAHEYVYMYIVYSNANIVEPTAILKTNDVGLWLTNHDKSPDGGKPSSYLICVDFSGSAKIPAPFVSTCQSTWRHASMASWCASNSSALSKASAPALTFWRSCLHVSCDVTTDGTSHHALSIVYVLLLLTNMSIWLYFLEYIQAQNVSNNPKRRQIDCSPLSMSTGNRSFICVCTTHYRINSLSCWHVETSWAISYTCMFFFQRLTVMLECVKTVQTARNCSLGSRARVLTASLERTAKLVRRQHDQPPRRMLRAFPLAAPISA